jgi:hypothetical protein
MGLVGRLESRSLHSAERDAGASFNGGHVGAKASLESLEKEQICFSYGI